MNKEILKKIEKIEHNIGFYSFSELHTEVLRNDLREIKLLLLIEEQEKKYSDYLDD